jgi:glycosyltransferase involved in cell wall biosynthesis
MRVIPNGIHLRDIDAVSPAHAACVPRAPDGTPVPYVVATGRLVAVKGLDTVVRALPHAAGIHAVFVGEGPAAPGLRRLARRLGVADRVHLPGWVEEDEKIRLLRGAVAYTHPARFEAFGISVLEALAAGAPVVAARTGGVPELVGDAGLLLDHGPAHWAAAMTTLRDDEAARADLGRRGRAQAARFGWERVAQDLETVYEEAVRAA